MYEYLTAFDGVPVGKKVGENVGPGVVGTTGVIVGKKVGLTLGRRGVGLTLGRVGWGWIPPTSSNSPTLNAYGLGGDNLPPRNSGKMILYAEYVSLFAKLTNPKLRFGSPDLYDELI